MDAEEIAKVLAEHRDHWSSAGWIGSPNPRDWRNIAIRCRCNQKIHEASHDGGAIADAHRTHVAAVLLPLVEQAKREGAAEALQEAAEELADIERIGDSYSQTGDELPRYMRHPLGDVLARIDGPESWEVRPIVVQWLRDRAQRAAQTAQNGATEPATGQTAPGDADGLNGRETGGQR